VAIQPRKRSPTVRISHGSAEKGTKTMTFVKKFMNDEEGQDLVEYALLLGFIAILAVVAVTTLGTKVNSYFTVIGSQLT
jgi:pilus assembly protein Flp/PilA